MKQLRNVVLLPISSLSTRDRSSSAQSVIIKQLRKVILLPILSPSTRERSFSAQSVIMKQLGKVVLLPISSLSTWDRSFNAQHVYLRQPGKGAYVCTYNLSMPLHKYIITGVLNKTKYAKNDQGSLKFFVREISVCQYCDHPIPSYWITIFMNNVNDPLLRRDHYS